MQLLKESLILHKLDHPSIVKFKGVNFRSFQDPTLLQPTIITEYLERGSLKENLNKEKMGVSDYDWTPTKKYITLVGVSDAMRYLHANGILHRDLKPENILIDSDYCPRICDFGLSKCFPDAFTKSMKLSMTGQVGTPLYMAPEIFRGDDHIDSSIDVYAFSILAYEIVSGEEPYSELGKKITPYQFMSKIIDGYRPKRVAGITDKMWSLLCKCWSNGSNTRPTFEYIFNELKNDITYFAESVDEKDLGDYLDRLSEIGETSKTKEKEESIQKLKNEVIELKNKICRYEEEKKILFSSNDDLQNAFISIFGPKKSRNSIKAFHDLNVSSSKGNCHASAILGFLYEAGEEVERDMNKAEMYFDKSGKQGNSSGFTRIGFYYDKNYGFKQDYSKAIEYYEKAAELGDSRALLNLGILYKNGRGVKQDYSKAIEYFERAIKLGNSDALFNLGFLYENGQGVKQDYSKAIEYYSKAVEQCNMYSLNNLGMLYESGRGVKQDYSKAIEYFEKAAELGDSRALLNLGILYENGRGVKQDYSKAIEYFERAAKLGNKYALNSLGILYENGQGVKQDYSKAIEYYEKAIENGYERAKQNLENLLPKI